MTHLLTFPVLPLRGDVLLPGVAQSISVGRPASLRALHMATAGDGTMVALAQKDDREAIDLGNFYSVGTLVQVREYRKVAEAAQVIIMSAGRVRITQLTQLEDGEILAEVESLPKAETPSDEVFAELERTLRRKTAELTDRGGFPEPLMEQLAELSDVGAFTDLVAFHLSIEVAIKQQILEAVDLQERITLVVAEIEKIFLRAETRATIRNRVDKEFSDRQREMVLREQMRAIRAELGEDEQGEVERLRERFDALELPDVVRTEVNRELKRLDRTPPQAPEHQVIRTYLDTLLELPWGAKTEDRLDLKHAQKILDRDHHGLESVKDRVLEFLAVRKLQIERAVSHEGRGPILLFMGPPGVGKTSIGTSIAEALGRKYVRVALGGVQDEADIRGHRRTYIGAMPGRIVQAMKQAGTSNPVLLLDEVDKLGRNGRGDPTAALLELLDPAQNHGFVDHYLGVPFDMSEVLFIATANYRQQIPRPLLDRMEAIGFAGYTEAEKLEIAKRHLLPKQIKAAGLDTQCFNVSMPALRRVISEHTHESGVRGLEREIGRLARKAARAIAEGQTTAVKVGKSDVGRLLGRPKTRPERARTESAVGVSTGMFYTELGGDILFVEASVTPGRDRLILTGQLGSVMQESAQAALSFAKRNAVRLGIPVGEAEGREVHVHVPGGAIPKDGPSAGVTIGTAIVSALTDRPVHCDVAMTGEITLSGRVLAVGGIKEKILGAHRAGIRRIVLPRENERDLEDLAADVRAAMKFHLVDTLEDVLAIALQDASQKHLASLAGFDAPESQLPAS
jgi:ATP-dependent Lon protease